jgi:glycolate oxidase
MFPTMQAATDAVAAIMAKLRPSMLELMDRIAINAVEDMVSMGLDRTAGALLVAQSDAPGAVAAEEIAIIQAVCWDHSATEAFRTTDPDESEAFAGARRAAVPAMERKGELLLEDVGVPLTNLSVLVAGIEAIAKEHNTIIGTWRTPAMATATRSSSTTPPIQALPSELAARSPR